MAKASCRLWMASLALGLAAWGGDALATRKSYPIGPFSDAYHATVTVEDNKDVFKPGAVSVFDSKTGKRLIHLEAEELAFDLRDGKASPNIKQLPYGEQSILIYEDFNFDGEKDLAIMDGQNSCYHGPSFQIYLATGKGFRRSEAFTELAQNFCGMFRIEDAAKKLLSTMTKSGCCWHQFNTYKVVDNRPELIRSAEDGFLGTMFRYHRFAVRENGKTKTEFVLEDDPSEGPSILAFDLKHSDKRVEVFMADVKTLDYALVGKNGEVEFSYVLDVLGYRNGKPARRSSPMYWNAAGTAISFRNGKYTYSIHEAPERFGVSVSVDKRTVFLEGDPGRKEGSLNGLGNLREYPANLLADDPLLTKTKGATQ